MTHEGVVASEDGQTFFSVRVLREISEWVGAATEAVSQRQIESFLVAKGISTENAKAYTAEFFRRFALMEVAEAPRRIAALERELRRREEEPKN